MMIDLKNEGLEVVAFEVSFPLGIGRKVYEQEQAWANHNYGSGIVYHVEPLCRHSEALAVIAEREARIAEQDVQIKALQSGETSWQSGYDEGRRMGAKHCTGTIDQLRAELVALNAKLDASKFCADVADDLRAELALSKAAYESAEDDHTKACAELADAKETISRYETTAENCDVLRAELASLKAQEPVSVIPAGYSLVPSRLELSPQDIACIMFMCGGDEEATEVDEQFNGGVLWVGNTVGDEGELTYGLHIACVECLEEGSTTIAEFAAPVAKQVVMPVQQASVPDCFESYRLADKFCEQRLVTDDHVRAIVVDAFASGYGFGIAASTTSGDSQ